LKDISRLLASWPSAAGEGDEQLRSYLLAVDDYPADDVSAAVDALIKGIAPDVNPSFLPPPAVVGAECHRQNHLRASREDLERRLHPRLPPPDVKRTPESQARVRDMVAGVIAKLAVDPGEDPVERHRRRVAKANAFFEAGDPEGQDDAA
jgi:hypothetical protein